MHGLGLQLWTGEDLPGDSTPEPAPTTKLQTLNVRDKNWDKVVRYVKSNKDAHKFDDIIKQLSTKYKIDAKVKAALKAKV